MKRRIFFKLKFFCFANKLLLVHSLFIFSHWKVLFFQLKGFPIKFSTLNYQINAKLSKNSKRTFLFVQKKITKFVYVEEKTKDKKIDNSIGYCSGSGKLVGHTHSMVTICWGLCVAWSGLNFGGLKFYTLVCDFFLEL